jgi:predicted phage tail protein
VFQEVVETVLIPGTEVIRTTAPNAAAVTLDFLFPQGLAAFNLTTGAATNLNMDLRIRLRPAGGGPGDWTDHLNPWTITSATRSAFRSEAALAFPFVGAWEIGVSRLTAEFDNLNKSGIVQWTTLRSHFSTPYLSFDRPLALLAIRIKATAQLNGNISNLNADVKRVCNDWDAATQQWVMRATNNPASLYRYVLQGPANAYPKANSEINLTKLQEWHDYCRINGLKYNRIHDYVSSIWDVLQDVAAAGRATPRDNGQTWDVVIDKPQDVVVGHLSPRNSWGFSGQRRYVRFPDAFRVSFLDETQDYKQVEQLVPWPGFTGEPDVTEEVQFPGITDPVQIFRETRRRQYELIHRADRYTVNQDIEGLVLTRGDLSVLSHDVLDRTQVAARVDAVDAAAGVVVLDTFVTIEAGVSYACRFRKADGSTLLALVSNSVVGERRALKISGSEFPEPGDLAFFGIASRESFEVIVQDIETADGPTFRLTLMDHAPQIEALVNADPLPAWAA